MSSSSPVTAAPEAPAKRPAALPHLLGLDALRAFGASVVVLGHYFFWHLVPGVGELSHLPNDTVDTQHPGIYFAYVAVEIFFIISGYVIVLSAETATPRQFAEARVLRLVPTVWICTTIVFLTRLTFEHASLGQLLTRYVRTMMFIPYFTQIDDVYWTLGIEVNFYLLLYFYVMPNFKQRIEWCARGLTLWSTGFWLACYFALALAGEPSSPLHWLDYYVRKAEGFIPLQLTLAQHGCFFATGILLWLCVERGVTRSRVFFLVTSVFASVLEMLTLNDQNRATTHVDLSPIPGLVFYVACLTFFVLSTVYNAQLARIFKGQRVIVRELGLMTCPLYLVHNAVGFAVVLFLTSHGVGLVASLLWAALTAFVVALAVSPMETWLRTRMKKALRKRWPVPERAPTRLTVAESDEPELALRSRPVVQGPLK